MMFCVRMILLLAPPVTLAGAAQLETTWEALPNLVTGKQVEVELAGRGSVAGRVVLVNSTALRIKVARSSAANILFNSEHDIPRTDVTRLVLTGAGVTGRIIGTIGGVVGGFFIAGTIFDKPGQIPIGQASAGAIAGGVGGYWLGSRLDRKRTEIRIRPDPLPVVPD
jgi:hypothetical protein